MPGWALARQPRPLTAELSTGAEGRHEVVLTFSRPVADFSAASPSFSVTGARIAGVGPSPTAGPANGYVITLAPDGGGTVAFALLAGQPCDAGGICAADGTTLSDVPAALTLAAGAGRQ